MTYEVTATSEFQGDAALVYRLLADYRAGHPSILPARYFSPIEILDGGVGEGTEIQFSIRAFGRERQVWAVVTEPLPGRVLVETDMFSGAVTRFEVLGQGDRVRVTIGTTMMAEPGWTGRLRRSLARAFLLKVYRAELEKLRGVVEDAAADRRGGGAGFSPTPARRRWGSAPVPPSMEVDLEAARFVEAP
jgi:hypothetical protein